MKYIFYIKKSLYLYTAEGSLGLILHWTQNFNLHLYVRRTTPLAHDREASTRTLHYVATMTSQLLCGQLCCTHMPTLWQANIQFITDNVSHLLVTMHISCDKQQILWHSLWSKNAFVDGVHDRQIYTTSILFNNDGFNSTDTWILKVTGIPC